MSSAAAKSASSCFGRFADEPEAPIAACPDQGVRALQQLHFVRAEPGENVAAPPRTRQRTRPPGRDRDCCKKGLPVMSSASSEAAGSAAAKPLEAAADAATPTEAAAVGDVRLAIELRCATLAGAVLTWKWRLLAHAWRRACVRWPCRDFIGLLPPFVPRARSGGLELLFGQVKRFDVVLSRPTGSGADEPLKMRGLLTWMRENLLKERPELFLGEGDAL